MQPCTLQIVVAVVVVVAVVGGGGAVFVVVVVAVVEVVATIARTVAQASARSNGIQQHIDKKRFKQS